MDNLGDLSTAKWQTLHMRTTWKIIRIIGLYVTFFIVSAIISAVILDSLPDVIEAVFILFAPVIFIIWYEKRRIAKIAERTTPAGNNPVRLRQLASDDQEVEDSKTNTRPKFLDVVPPSHPPISQESVGHPTTSESGTVGADIVAASIVSPRSKVTDQSTSPYASLPSRTRELRERLFSDDSSFFDSNNTDRVQAMAARTSWSSGAGAEDELGGLIEPASSGAYRRSQDNAELVRVGKAAREALEAASLRRAAERQSGMGQKLFVGDRRSQPPPTSAELHPASRARSSSIKQGWLQKGQVVTIAGREINGMVYVGTPPNCDSQGYGEKCRTYIDPALSVSSYGSDKNGDAMSYWPGYSSIPAVCRATFYGLERRFLVDQPSQDEKREIVAEVERLKALFVQDYSVQRYLGEFLDIARIAAMGGLSLDDPALKQSILENRSWDLPFSLKFALGGMISEGRAFDAEWMYLWLLCHPERRLRTPAERCGEEFKALFKLKFDALYPSGLKVRTPRKKLKMNYRAASSEFSCSINLTAGEGKEIAVPDVSDLRSPVQKAQNIADEAMEELDKFSRYLGRNADGRGSLEAQALLPSELWGLFPSAALEELKKWAREKMVGGGLVPALEVVSRLEGRSPEKIGKRQLTGAADALARIGFGMAPDPRFSMRGPRIDEPVVIFELGETVLQLEDVSPAYRAALFELALAIFVAHSDSNIVEAERRALKDKIEATGSLTELEKKRLHANLKWYLEVPPDMSWLRSRLKEVDAEHHLALRAAVVVIAHADSVIRSEEVACIEKIYNALGIDPGLVYADLHAGDVSEGPVRVRAAEAEALGERIPAESKARVGALDAARIAAIRTDTERVSNVLGEIFAADDDRSGEAVHIHKLPSSLAGLDHKHAALVDLLVEREHWTQQDFTDLAGRQGLLSSGALEAINEWAFEKFDEALLDEYDGYDVSKGIAEALRAEMVKGDS